ncbi:MAG: 16S rRNA (uracil(1498)-N(3))-methyltransferase [Mastigocoleus sp. MO_167.B18]|nr:16S rRNA (uracil(1498)-N(3))-methyltransferase [Mastigocoleus sp. MO_167.B18]
MRQLQRIAIAASQKQQEQIVLTAKQKHYLCRVLRLGEGGKFIAMDGEGQWWLTELRGEEARILEKLEVENQELPISVTLISAIPKNGFDEIVRCCTELGVSCIAPVISKRTLLKPSPQKLQRWQKIAQEASEQSERAFVPNIIEPVNFEQSLSLFPDSENSVAQQKKYICTARGDSPHLLACVSDQKYTVEQEKPCQIWLATGPEGGWTEKEIELATEAGFQTVSLGKRILRSVTAPIFALSVVAAALESIAIESVDVKF